MSAAAAQHASPFTHRLRRAAATWPARLCLLLLIAVLAPAVPASAAATTTSTTTEMHGERGGSAAAEFLTSDGCFDQAVFVFASTHVFRPQPYTYTYAQVTVVTTNTCTGEETTLFGQPEAVVHRQSDARVGRVSADIELWDWNDGTSAGVHRLDVDVEVVGQPERGRGGFVHRWPGGQMVYHGVGSWAEATATGALVAPDGTDLLAGQFGTGSLDWTTTVQVALTRTAP